MTRATVGSRYQVVIPRREREKLGIAPHAKVEVEVRGEDIVIHPLKSEGWRGIGKDVADERDAIDYVRELRAEWGTRR